MEEFLSQTFRYALMELKGRTADPDIIGDIMLLQYGKAKNRYIQSWINQAKINNIPKSCKWQNVG